MRVQQWWHVLLKGTPVSLVGSEGETMKTGEDVLGTIEQTWLYLALWRMVT